MASFSTHPGLRTKLTPIVGEPTNATLHVLQFQMEQNAIAFNSSEGNGISGHLIIVIGEDEYLERTGVAYSVVDNPGPFPNYSNIPDPTPIERENIKDVFKAEALAYKLHLHVESVLTTALLEAVDNDYLNGLRVNGSLQTSTCLEILTYLHETYGEITLADLAANMKNLTRDWTPDEQMVKLWTRVTECCRFAESAGQPIAEAHVINSLLEMFERTGVFGSAIDDWNKKDSEEMTVQSLEKHFNKANKTRALKLTTGKAGYHGANSVVEMLRTEIASMKTEMASLQIALAATKVTPRAPRKQFNPAKPVYYCWSHGLSNFEVHTSKTCNRRKEGHKEDATKDNQMGGSTKNITV